MEMPSEKIVQKVKKHLTFEIDIEEIRSRVEDKIEEFDNNEGYANLGYFDINSEEDRNFCVEEVLRDIRLNKEQGEF